MWFYFFTQTCLHVLGDSTLARFYNNNSFHITILFYCFHFLLPFHNTANNPKQVNRINQTLNQLGVDTSLNQTNENQGDSNIQTIKNILKNETNFNYSTMKNNLQIPIKNYEYVKSDNQNIDLLRKSASQYFNNSDETRNFINTIEKLISNKDYNVTFDDTLRNKNGNSVNAQITTNKSGKVEIKINPNSNRAGEFLLVPST